MADTTISKITDIKGNTYDLKDSNAERSANKVSTITASSTNTQYPSALAVWTLFNSIQNGNGVSY